MPSLAQITDAEFRKLLDFNVLRKDATRSDILAGLETTLEYEFACFYTGSVWTPLVASALSGSGIEVGTVVDFPFGNSASSVKIAATRAAREAGATAIDMMLNIGLLRGAEYEALRHELREHVAAADGAKTKVMIEVAYLTDAEIRVACELLVDAGVSFAKTSSGQSEGPSLEQILTMKEALEGTQVNIKAGVKFPFAQNATAFIQAGVSRIGSHRAPEIADSFPQLRALAIVPALEAASPGNGPSS